MKRLALALLFYSVTCFSFVDDSIGIFFPKSLQFLQLSQTEFSVFWWNFIIIQPESEKPRFEEADKLCQALDQDLNSLIKRKVCGDQIGGFENLLKEWADDFSRRTLYKPADLKNYAEKMEASLAEISFLSSGKKEIFNLKRSDPFDQWQVYMNLSDAMTPASFLRDRGFLIDKKTNRIVIPIQFSKSPKMVHVEKLFEKLQSFHHSYLIGAHSSAYYNEKQVHTDMNRVTWVSLLVFISFIVFLMRQGTLSALLLVPPVLISMAVAAVCVVFIDGSIHGLTLAFGTGIIGLALDYGLHGSFNAQSTQIWKSNFIGYFTTLSGLAVLALSPMPLIRQMMIFAIIGISVAFFSYLFIAKKMSKYFVISKQIFHIPLFQWGPFFVLFFIAWGILNFQKINLKLDLRQFNYQPQVHQELMTWFFGGDSKKDTFIRIHDSKEFENLNKSDEIRWAESEKIKYVGLSQYLSSKEIQKTNQESWVQRGCPDLISKVSTVSKKVYKPFFDKICQPVSPYDFERVNKLDYVNHLTRADSFVTLYMAETDEQKNQIKTHIPEAHSLVDGVLSFSDDLRKNLYWMIPLSLTLCCLILFIYYRRLIFVFSAVIPFLSGVGLCFLWKTFFQTEINLISILGFLMVFGFSLDYGVFASDVFAFPLSSSRISKVNSAITLAALANIIGFAPMMIAEHPILKELGTILFFGTVGTYLGSIWGVGSFLIFWEKTKWRPS